jgi:hypothetical protein
MGKFTNVLQFTLFHSVRNKLLILMITLSLLPLTGMAVFSYFKGSRTIQNSIKLSLETIAQDTADKIDLMLLAKEREIISMATTYPLIFHGSIEKDRSILIPLLNNYCSNHPVYDYDALIVLDRAGNFIGINSKDFYLNSLPEKKVSEILSRNISAFPEEHKLFLKSLEGISFNHDWYRSKLVQSLYD